MISTNDNLLLDTRVNIFSNKSGDIVNYDNTSSNYKADIMFSPVTNDTRVSFCDSKPLQNLHNSNTSMVNLDENLMKAIDMKKAHIKIKHMEDCLKSMNSENENLRDKLGDVINYINNPQIEESVISTDRPQKKRNNSTIITNPLFDTSNITERRKAEFVPLDRICPTSLNSTKKSRDLTPVRSVLNSSSKSIRKSKEIFMNNYCTEVRSDNRQDEQEDVLQDTFEDNIIEFPLQLKIKGKIKSIVTCSDRRK